MSDPSNRSNEAIPDADQILGEVRDSLSSAANQMVPWFYREMPEYYFRTHDRVEQVAHLHALVSGQATAEGHVLSLKSPCGTKVTYISPGGGMDALNGVIAQLSHESILNARMYASHDRQLRLDSFILDPQGRVDRESVNFHHAVEQTRASGLLSVEDVEEFGEFLATATGDCVDKFEIERAVRHFEIYRRIKNSDRVHVSLEKDIYPGLCRIIVSMMNPPSHGALLTMNRILGRSGAEVERAYLDVYDTPGQALGIMSFYVTQEGFTALGDATRWAALAGELQAVKWFASGHTLETFADEEGMSVHQVMFLMAAAEFAHQFLLKKDPYAYTSANIVHAVLTNRKAAWAVLKYFEARFDPDDSDREGTSRQLLEQCRQLRQSMGDDIVADTFAAMETFVSHTLRTNYYIANRFGLSFRMDPMVLDHLPRKQGLRQDSNSRPYGFFFFQGAHFQGFHVRYREMARGGVRVVPTRTQEQFELESNRLFDEVTALAHSQQHKNKDIPEGGSKAVILLGPLGDIDLAVKSMTNSLLDIIVSDGDSPTLPRVVDYIGHEEIIYLGPDENITTDHIRWIVARAAKRGYRWPSAYMSSKPETGINHKVYGVTSLGVMVFAEEILKLLGIDPFKESFSVKFTGGTRGDVASNAMRILIRDYGENARILAATDGHGALYDPDGLDHGELLRLSDAVLGVSEFDKSKLKGQGAFVVSTADPDGAHLRDTLHNTVQADLFIPSGGRPDTINEKNWQEFLLEDGTPSAKAIVEGANIFISDPARDRLQEKGVLILHGASANKTGVICSSYEILAGLAMSEQEFLAEKDEYVSQVLGILRERARAEARLIIREYKSCGGCRPMTEISMDLSKEINTLADLIDVGLKERYPTAQALREDSELYALLLAYCPRLLAERYADRLIERVPLSHLRALLAAFSASRSVYAEGIGWLRGLTAVHDVNEVVHAYLRQEKRLAGYIEGLVKSDAPGREEISRILLATGRKYLTGRDLGMEPD
ncbi:NAD-glutamate dehydrogenase domain-containing protein [Desulfovibrio ferrophilus]|uniref:Glu/Leu/Phe/Val dehydrogenase n=1 Tax=Desulfovibrio ferrophilus TaxID=241368 RepID=A0A2Z6AUI4_9BACT|nr:NAD-glutamate dehydrogenase domain-containing protein [Desulfovibrio ferrophilus]BBD06897.1 Glu/Leu/Phe/Val dehydrogenase [Desulfovibrio ferrophilus]